jgi:hypothetical protein
MFLRENVPGLFSPSENKTYEEKVPGLFSPSENKPGTFSRCPVLADSGSPGDLS